MKLMMLFSLLLLLTCRPPDDDEGGKYTVTFDPNNGGTQIKVSVAVGGLDCSRQRMRASRIECRFDGMVAQPCCKIGDGNAQVFGIYPKLERVLPGQITLSASSLVVDSHFVLHHQFGYGIVEDVKFHH